jgi:hypothetical protein
VITVVAWVVTHEFVVCSRATRSSISREAFMVRPNRAAVRSVDSRADQLRPAIRSYTAS